MRISQLLSAFLIIALGIGLSDAADKDFLEKLLAIYLPKASQQEKAEAREKIRRAILGPQEEFERFKKDPGKELDQKVMTLRGGTLPESLEQIIKDKRFARLALAYFLSLKSEDEARVFDYLKSQYALKASPSGEAALAKSSLIFTTASATTLPFSGDPLANMVLIPSGDFTAGSDDPRDNALPKQTIFLEAFYLDVREVTNAEFLRFKTNHNFARGRENHPAVDVSWNEANEYCLWAGKRLPTELEWEKAARGADGRRWPWGPTFERGRANTAESRSRGTAPVTSYETGRSPYGIYDLIGNAWEWTDSWYNEKKETKVLRGGSWNTSATSATAVYRGSDLPDNSDPSYGFRCAKSP